MRFAKLPRNSLTENRFESHHLIGNYGNEQYISTDTIIMDLITRSFQIIFHGELQKLLSEEWRKNIKK